MAASPAGAADTEAKVARIVWAPDRRVPRRISARYQGHNRICVLNWGDGHRQDLATNALGSHTYARPGTYMLVIEDIGLDPPVLDVESVLIPEGTQPDIAWRTDPDDPQYLEYVFPDDPGTGGRLAAKFLIDWQDDQPDAQQEVWGLPGAVVRRRLPTGQREVYLKNLASQRWRNDRHTITAKAHDPGFSLAEDSSDPTRQTAMLTLTTVTTTKPIVLDWADGTATEDVATPAVGQTFTHRYARAGGYLPQVTYRDRTGGGVDLINVPFTDPSRSGAVPARSTRKAAR